MKYNKEEILEIYDDQMTKSEAGRIYAKKKGFEYNDTVRKAVSKIINDSTNSEDDVEAEIDTKTNQYDEKGNILSAINPETGKYMDIWTFCDYWEIPKEHVKSYKAVNSQNGGIPTYNIASHILKGEYFDEFYQKLLDEIADTANRPSTIYRSQDIPDEEEYLLVVDPADIHIGKLSSAFEVGEPYDNQIAVQRAKEGVRGILDKARGYKIDKIMFVGGNDILHIDTPKRTTTSGTSQDTDGMWYDNFLIAKQLYIDLISELLEVADVHFVYNPSNHDYVHGFFLADVIQTYFKDVDNITFDCTIAHRKYFTYHNNLIGTTHGDGAKINDLPLLMANESSDWSSTKHRYVYTHHVHHKFSKDHPGVTVESLRSPSTADGWHHRNGYDHAPKAIEGYIHSKKHGQVARLTHIF